MKTLKTYIEETNELSDQVKKGVQAFKNIVTNEPYNFTWVSDPIDKSLKSTNLTITLAFRKSDSKDVKWDFFNKQHENYFTVRIDNPLHEINKKPVSVWIRFPETYINVLRNKISEESNPFVAGWINILIFSDTAHYFVNEMKNIKERYITFNYYESLNNNQDSKARKVIKTVQFIQKNFPSYYKFLEAYEISLKSIIMNNLETDDIQMSDVGHLF